MVQFNLLPDVKKEYLKTKRTKRLITSVASLVTLGFIVLTALMFSWVKFGQTTHINNLTDDIKSETARIQSTEDLSKILTVQQQMGLLPEVHQEKPETSRIFEFVKLFSTKEAKLRELSVNTVDGEIMLEGTTPTIANANKMIDNMKAVQYAVFEPDEDAPTDYTDLAYEIVDSSVSRGDDDIARFTISATFDPAIFRNSNEVVMRLVGRQISTVEVVNNKDDEDGNSDEATGQSTGGNQ